MTTEPSPFRVTIAEAMVAVGLVAVALRWPLLASIVVPVLGFFILWRLGWVGRDILLKIITPTLAAVYLPCLIGFTADCSHCKEAFLKMFAIVPGVIPTMFVLRMAGFGRLPDMVEFALAGVVTCLQIVVLVYLGKRGVVWFIACLIVGMIWSGVAAWILVSVLRA